MERAARPRTPTAVELTNLISARQLRLYDLTPANGLLTLAEALKSKRSNEQLYLVSVVP